MSQGNNRISNFWQELKRRNVLRSLTIYAGSAYIIFEATTLIFPRWGFPDWSIDLVLYLLIFGAFINIVIAWIFDLTPKGVEKTKPSSELQEGEKRAVSNSWRIATYVSIVVIIGLILLNIFSLSKVSESLTQYGKSIAVLPFINDTPDKENNQFINGTMESILNNLSKIKDLRVVSRNSVEQYRDTIIPIPKVAEEQRVSYVLKGSMQKYGDRIRITLYLIDQNDMLMWSEQYDEEIKEAAEYFDFWSEIAQLVADELQVVITPEEKERIEKIQTVNLVALNYYLQATEEYMIAWREKDTIRLKNAEYFYYKALEEDSTYARAYVGLSWILYLRYKRSNRFDNMNMLDSMVNLTNIALSYDNQLAEAYSVRGIWYAFKGEPDKALEDYNKALQFNPNDFFALRGRGHYYRSKDYVKAFENYYAALARNRGQKYELWNIIGILSSICRLTGFIDKAEYYNQELLKLSRDSTEYYANLSYIELNRCNWEKLIKVCNKRLALDSTDMDALLNKGAAYALLKEYKESLGCFEKLLDGMNASGDTIYQSMKWISFAYLKNGNQELADYYIEKELEYWNSLNEQRGIPEMHRAMAFAYQGMKEEALTELREFYNLYSVHSHLYLIMMTNWPFFDSIRDDPEFRKILNDMETKYQAEHERVRQWLEENDR